MPNQVERGDDWRTYPSPVRTVVHVVYYLKLRRLRAGRQSVAQWNKCVCGESSEDFSVGLHGPTADPRLGSLRRPPCRRVWLPVRRIGRRFLKMTARRLVFV